ncbi:TNF receptor-associated factor 2-like isoform X5 [Phyllopteryx taeniolatus]|uniref:TNF receptor-associated factor 2-like isoform X5 n=1 Tax=Phyllopteryx taeniolatus TaxID=161469 RepID=UPI002AD2B4D9|nr:TNF receptor-associated factor 2-like isoform X5 [Phyllopteryx taeniolatus]
MAAQEPSPPSSLEGNKPGFPKKILANNLEDKHLCNSCLKILRRPLQAQCGHRFCSYCFNKIVSSGPEKCNACIKEDLFEEPTSILKQGGAFPDNAARREVEVLVAVCPNEGCTWTGTIKDFEAHDEICPKYPMICDGCAKKKIPREKYVDHIKFCSKFKAPCRFHVVGCDTSVEKEKIHDHERQCSYEHLNLLLHFIMGIKVSLESLQPQSLEVAGHKLQELHQSLRDLELKMSHLGGGGAAASMQGSFTPLPSTVGAALELQVQNEKTKVVELSRRCQELELKVNTFEDIVCVLNREMECSCTTMEAYNRQHRLDQDKIEILNNKVRQLERTVSLRDLSIVEMEGKMREMSAATYDGIFVWKISDFTKKRQDAVAGRAPAMFSPAFYTSKYGYKMCLRIYLNGDGTGRGTHLSLFFVVMRGHSDALLKWPFNQKCLVKAASLFKSLGSSPSEVMTHSCSGHSNAAGPEQQGAHHRCVPARHLVLFLPEARQRYEHCQWLPALLSALQVGL